MIQRESLLKCVDNSGAAIVKCIYVQGGSRVRFAKLGNYIKCSVQEFEFKKKVAKKQVYGGLIVGTKVKTRRLDGTFIKSDNNRCVLMAKDADKFLGTRVSGPIPREIRGGSNEIKYKQLIGYAGATV
jgi:large subunit ribosomal protein L14